MDTEQYDVVLEESQDDDDEPSSSENDMDENDDVLNGNEDVLNDEDDDELLEDEDNNSPSSLPHPVAAVTSVATPAVPLAVPSASVVTVAAVKTEESTPDSKRQRVESTVLERKPPPPSQLDESRRLFQRLWTDEDEIELLQGFLDYTTSKTASNSSSSHHHHHHYDTAQFYDQIKSKLQLDFNKNQLVEKLRRLKKKYRNVMTKIDSGKDFSFKSPHDQATFEISRKIWSNANGIGKVEDTVLDDDENNNNNNNVNVIDESGERRNSTPKSTGTKKRSRSKVAKSEEKRVLNDGFVVANNNSNSFAIRSNIENGNVEGIGGVGGGGNVAGVIEDTVRSCLTPLFKELLGGAMGGGVGGCGGRGIGGFTMNAMPLTFGGSLSFGGVGGKLDLMDERWRRQQILELEVYSKRVELVQDQIKAALEELRSKGG